MALSQVANFLLIDGDCLAAVALLLAHYTAACQNADQ